MKAKMSNSDYSEYVALVFPTLSNNDLALVELFIEKLGVNETVFDSIMRFHFQLSIAAVIEEIRSIEVGAKEFKKTEIERLELILKDCLARNGE